LTKTSCKFFLESLDYVLNFYTNISHLAKPLHDRLRNNLMNILTLLKRYKKKHVQEILCLYIANPLASKIVKTDVSELSYGGILKQVQNFKKYILQFTSTHWNECQKNYSTIKKQILSIFMCIIKFQSDLLNQKFVLHIDCKSVKEVLQKDIQNLVSKQIFA